MSDSPASKKPTYPWYGPRDWYIELDLEKCNNKVGDESPLNHRPC
jgi:hypothetical protein